MDIKYNPTLGSFVNTENDEPVTKQNYYNGLQKTQNL